MGMKRRNLWVGVPLVAASTVGVGFYDILGRMKKGTYTPHTLPSPFIGKKPPDFTLPGICGLQGFSNINFLNLSRPVLVNWFASWCEDCTQEADILLNLSAADVQIWGIAYEDNSKNIFSYLKKFGNPYQRLATDQSGLTAINWGVYGVPETYFIDKQGIVRLRYAGPLNSDIVDREIMPLLRQYS